MLCEDWCGSKADITARLRQRQLYAMSGRRRGADFTRRDVDPASGALVAEVLSLLLRAAVSGWIWRQDHPSSDATPHESDGRKGEPLAVSATSNAGSVSVAPSVETGASWFAAAIVLFIFTFSYGAPLVVVVSLKEVAAEFDNVRSIPALAHALAWLGSGTGALAFGWVAERLGIRPIVWFGAVMLGSGLAVAALGGPEQLLIGHGLLLLPQLTGWIATILNGKSGFFNVGNDRNFPLIACPAKGRYGSIPTLLTSIGHFQPEAALGVEDARRSRRKLLGFGEETLWR